MFILSSKVVHSDLKVFCPRWCQGSYTQWSSLSYYLVGYLEGTKRIFPLEPFCSLGFCLLHSPICFSMPLGHQALLLPFCVCGCSSGLLPLIHRCSYLTKLCLDEFTHSMASYLLAICRSHCSPELRPIFQLPIGHIYWALFSILGIVLEAPIIEWNKICSKGPMSPQEEEEGGPRGGQSYVMWEGSSWFALRMEEGGHEPRNIVGLQKAGNRFLPRVSRRNTWF